MEIIFLYSLLPTGKCLTDSQNSECFVEALTMRVIVYAAAGDVRAAAVGPCSHQLPLGIQAI